MDQRFRKYFCTLERIQAKQGDGKQVVFMRGTIPANKIVMQIRTFLENW